LIAFVLAAASASDSPLTAPLAAMLQSPGSGADAAAAAGSGTGVVDGERVDADAAAAASSPMTSRTAVVMPDDAEITAAADAPAVPTTAIASDRGGPPRETRQGLLYPGAKKLCPASMQKTRYR
jgi:hypothetical protein